MSNNMRLFFILLLNFFIVLNGQSQTKSKNLTFSQKDFQKNKIFENTYHLWSHNYHWGPTVKDTVSYFVDDRNYKGIVNYGVNFRSKDYRLFSLIEDLTMFYLNVEIENCNYDLKDSTITIKGFVSGGWGIKIDKELNDPKNHIEIFIGNKTDTITNYYYKSPVNKDKVETIWKNQIIDQGHLMDSFPSFYFKNPIHVSTNPEGKRPFKITAKVDKNSIIAFGGSNCYSEIFDIGSMVYFPKKNIKNKIKKEEIKKSIALIVKNQLVNRNEEPQEINYYTYTEKAENFILRGQYSNAKETYQILNKEYNTLYARDLDNALRCAILSRDYKNAVFWSEKLANKGITIKYFNAAIFSKFKKTSDWNNFALRFDSISSESRKRLNISLKNKVEELLQEDQSNYGLSNRKEAKVLFKTTEIVTDKLIELLKKDGFPSEEKIGVYTKNDTTLVFSPDYNVLIRHAIQQRPKNLTILLRLLDKSEKMREYDSKRSGNTIFIDNSCFHIYKGNLYNAKSCGVNQLMVTKMKFMFKNPHKFTIYNGNYVVRDYTEENSEENEKFYNENFNLILKLTDDWKFYE